jgi:predicted unusual protein kinase regulating ubiquinone biosynthesis (AarF/ABC1/UbiB family)
VTQEEIDAAIAELLQAIETMKAIHHFIETTRRKQMRTEQEMFLIPEAISGVQRTVSKLKRHVGMEEW